MWYKLLRTWTCYVQFPPNFIIDCICCPNWVSQYLLNQTPCYMLHFYELQLDWKLFVIAPSLSLLEYGDIKNKLNILPPTKSTIPLPFPPCSFSIKMLVMMLHGSMPIYCIRLVMPAEMREILYHLWCLNIYPMYDALVSWCSLECVRYGATCTDLLMWITRCILDHVSLFVYMYWMQNREVKWWSCSWNRENYDTF